MWEFNRHLLAHPSKMMRDECILFHIYIYQGFELSIKEEIGFLVYNILMK